MPDTPHDHLRVTLLGPVRAWRGDRELALGPARQRTVFAVLAAHANRPVGRDELVKAVWGTAAPETAAGNIYTYVSGVRRCLRPSTPPSPDGPEVLTSGPSGYTLRLADGATDLDRFQRWCTEATDLLAAGNPAGAVARLEQALGLWHGDAYAGSTGPFIELDRQRLTGLRLTAVEQRVRTLLDSGGDDGLVAELTGLVREHPLHEPAYELLMLALHQAGRHTEALETFRDARRTLVDGLGVEPSPRLSRLHRSLLGGTRGPVAGARPVPVAREPRMHGHPYVGRDTERDLLRRLVGDVARGSGGAVWINGEPGIGKSALLAVAFGDANRHRCRLVRGVADELGQRVPLQVITKAFGLDDLTDGTDAAADQLIAHVRRLCASTPLVLAIDDMHWADEATMLVWERLAAATRRLPLLLVAAGRPEPNGRNLSRLRRGVEARQGHVLTLRPMPAEDITTLIARIVGAEPGTSLRALTPRMAGNPLFARELASALVRQGAVHIVDGVADVDAGTAADAPQSLLAAVRGTVDFLGPDTQGVLQLAALLGMEFAVADVAAVTGRPPAALMSCLDEAVAANVVVDAGRNLAFRHPYLRQALLERVPALTRAIMHRHAAQALARGAGSATRVAEQLTAEAPAIDAWVVSWLADHHAELVRRAPELASQLTRGALDTDLPDPAQRATLLAALVRAEYRLERHPVALARQALAVAIEPADREEMRYLLAIQLFQREDSAGAIVLLRDAVHDAAVPDHWRNRHRALLASVRRGNLDDLDLVEHRARQLLAEAVAAGQQYEAAYALQSLWHTDSVRRDHQRALEHVDRALTIVKDPSLAGTHLDLLDNRVFTLQNLDRLDEAQRTLHDAARFARRHGIASGVPLAAAVHYYWLGHWDEAMAEISTMTADPRATTFHGIRESGATTMLLHGLAALIAAHRGAPELTAAHLEEADSRPASFSERESCDFLMAARSVLAQQENRPEEALSMLAPLLLPAYSPLMLRHQWLPDAARLALAVDRRDLAEQAATICAAEATKEVVPARAFAAAARCRALMTGDPGPALAAAARYRAVGRVPELAATLEDAAVLLAGRERFTRARAAGREAVQLFDALSATWDANRARRRLGDAGASVDAAPSLPAVVG
ncbi:BTAD domain-containing putative transcriptional regulator [Actinoplanes sp. NPDC049118]|uniref:BTAD domain-containing putative transcriptional regulator n=1 Tax=Actinoplanes sp. NPDC049118 TaxID=3155769 RepID=UPI0033E7C754